MMVMIATVILVVGSMVMVLVILIIKVMKKAMVGLMGIKLMTVLMMVDVLIS